MGGWVDGDSEEERIKDEPGAIPRGCSAGSLTIAELVIDTEF